MTRFPALLGILLVGALLSGCADSAYRARYEAERARYWAQRGDRQFALESNPQVRQGHLASALRHLRAAELSDPAPHVGHSDEGLLRDLRRLHGESLVQAGRAYLLAGRQELADPVLERAQRGALFPQRRRAAWLRGRGCEELDRLDEAAQRYEELLALSADDPDATPPPRHVLEIPAAFAQRRAARGETEALQEWCARGRDWYDRVAARWKDDPAARRAAFLRHRLAVLERRWDLAIDDLQRFETVARGEDLWRARLNRAEIEAGQRGAIDRADSLYRGVIQGAGDGELRGLARLRRVDLLLRAGDRPALRDSLEGLARELQAWPRLAAAADFRLARLQREAGEWATALGTYRRIILRHGDTYAGLRAPQELIEVQRQRGPEDYRLEGARRDAMEDYRRVLAAHPGDSDVGVRARRLLVDCLLETERPEEALLELEQLYHLRGRTLDGMGALFEAARIAREVLGDELRARRYLERILREMPGTRLGRAAEEELRRLDASPVAGPEDGH